ncbi:hypothetical protein [Shumkonia mesophila]|uniref:hypothetical protein n=1 Tax=Shumkonia mesophila TaxID=2838854 RepID=UPI002934F7EA|nr:hypothetical protein [Shumkonia mesophila]
MSVFVTIGSWLMRTKAATWALSIGSTALSFFGGGSVLKIMKWAIPAALILGAGGYIWFQHHHISDLSVERENAVLQRDAAGRQAEIYAAAAKKNADAFAKMKADHERTLAAIDKLQAATDARQAENNSLRKELSDVAKTENRVVGPVLKRLLDRLHDGAVAGSKPASS